MNKLSIKTVVAVGIGAALFFLIGRFVSIPTGIPNTNIQLQFALLALFAVLYGKTAGFLIAFFGTTLIDFTLFGNPWWTWIVAAGLYGVALGFLGQKLQVEAGQFTVKDAIFFNIGQLVAAVLAWGVLAPVGDILIYRQPAEIVFAQGVVAGIANVVTVAVAGTALLTVYAKTRVSSGSLSKD